MSTFTTVRFAQVLGFSLCLYAGTPNVAEAKCRTTRVMTDREAVRFLASFSNAVSKSTRFIKAAKRACKTQGKAADGQMTAEFRRTLSAWWNVSSPQCTTLPQDRFTLRKVFITAQVVDAGIELHQLDKMTCK